MSVQANKTILGTHSIQKFQQTSGMLNRLYIQTSQLDYKVDNSWITDSKIPLSLKMNMQSKYN